MIRTLLLLLLGDRSRDLVNVEADLPSATLVVTRSASGTTGFGLFPETDREYRSEFIEKIRQLGLPFYRLPVGNHGFQVKVDGQGGASDVYLIDRVPQDKMSEDVRYIFRKIGALLIEETLKLRQTLSKMPSVEEVEAALLVPFLRWLVEDQEALQDRKTIPFVVDVWHVDEIGRLVPHAVYGRVCTLIDSRKDAYAPFAKKLLEHAVQAVEKRYVEWANTLPAIVRATSGVGELTEIERPVPVVEKQVQSRFQQPRQDDPPVEPEAPKAEEIPKEPAVAPPPAERVLSLEPEPITGLGESDIVDVKEDEEPTQPDPVDETPAPPPPAPELEEKREEPKSTAPPPAQLGSTAQLGGSTLGRPGGTVEPEEAFPLSSEPAAPTLVPEEGPATTTVEDDDEFGFGDEDEDESTKISSGPPVST